MRGDIKSIFIRPEMAFTVLLCLRLISRLKILFKRLRLYYYLFISAAIYKQYSLFYILQYYPRRWRQIAIRQFSPIVVYPVLGTFRVPAPLAQVAVALK